MDCSTSVRLKFPWGEWNGNRQFLERLLYRWETVVDGRRAKIDSAKNVLCDVMRGKCTGPVQKELYSFAACHRRQWTK